MKAVKYIVGVWAGVLIYVLSSLGSGATGLDAYRQLEEERDREQANIETLKAINDELESTRNALLYDEETWQAYAREMGYAAEEERFVRIVGTGPLNQRTYTPGEVVQPMTPLHTPHRALRIFSFCAAFTILACMGAYDFLQYLKDR